MLDVTGSSIGDVNLVDCSCPNLPACVVVLPPLHELQTSLWLWCGCFVGVTSIEQIVHGDVPRIGKKPWS